MRLTAHSNSSQDRMAQLEHQLGQVRSVLMGMIEGAIEREGLMDMLSLSEAGMLDASGDSPDDQGRDEDNVDANVTNVRFEPVEPGFEPEPNLFEPLLVVRFSWVRMGSVWGSTPGIL